MEQEYRVHVLYRGGIQREFVMKDTPQGFAAIMEEEIVPAVTGVFNGADGGYLTIPNDGQLTIINLQEVMEISIQGVFFSDNVE